jgi:predicted  nucleic acid-binding Zn-ribbon protein
MEDSVQITCTRCKSTFRDRARRIQSGYSRQCPNCEVIIFFEDASFDKNVQAALKEAKKVRRALREEEEKSHLSRAPSHREGDGREDGNRVVGEGRKIGPGRRAGSGRNEET